MEERRLEGGRLLKAGKLSQAEIARQLGVSRATVSDWAQKVKAEGIRGLRKRTAKGGTSKLTKEQKQRLKQLLDGGALAQGFSTDRWTLQRVHELIKHEFKVSYHPNYLNRLLENLGFSPQKLAKRYRAGTRVGAGLDGARFSEAKKSRSGSAQNSCFGMNLVSPFKRRWRRLGHAKENDQFSEGSPLIAALCRQPWH